MQRPLKSILFRLHWISGITAGLVLAVVGVTGALLGFEAELVRLLNPKLHVAAESGTPPKSLGTLLDAARAAHADLAVRSVAWNGDDSALIVRMARGRERGGEDIAIDPYSGVDLGTLRGTGFFETVEQVHRNLAAGPGGKQIVGASTALLILMAISGVVLRWPRKAASPRAWLTFNTRLRGRPFLWHLHSVLATWLLVFYLIAGLTGLWWSYDFYRNAVNRMAGVPAQQRRPPSDARADLPAASVEAAWATFRREIPDASRATLTPSADGDAPLEIRYQTPESPHSRAWNTLKIDTTNGSIVGGELYAAQPRGRRFVSSLLPLHTGDFFGLPGRVAMALAALMMPFFAVTGFLMWIARRRNAALRARNAAGAVAAHRGPTAASPVSSRISSIGDAS